MQASLVLIDPPELEPVSVAEAKAHARVDIDDEDSQFTQWIIAARKQAEQYTRRQFVTAEWRYRLDGFPGGDGTIYIPKPPLQDIKQITYVTTAGTPATLDVSYYSVDEATEPGRLYEAWGRSWPATRPVRQSVSVYFHAGYGNDAEDVPEDIRQAILMLVSFMHEHREAYIDTPFDFKTAPQAFFDILREHRVPEFMTWYELVN